MTEAKLQQAITSIKAGDRQTGQQLLTEVLKADPGNETAWLWMSALVTGEKRRLCLEKVLSINPNHAQARAQLAKLSPSVPVGAPVPVPVAEVPKQSATSVDSPAPPHAQPVSVALPKAFPVVSVSDRDAPAPQIWLTPGRHMSSVIYLLGDVLLTFEVLPDRASQVLGEIKKGVTAQQLETLKKQFHLQSINSMPVRKVSSVRLFGEELKLTFTDGAGTEKTVKTSVSKDNAETILRALQERLGPGFQRVNRPISRVTVMISAIVLFLLTLCGTGFFYWLARGLAAEGQVGGSARARGIATLLLLIGPNGFLCIGAGLLIIVTIAMISSLRKPPQETVLTRAAAPAKKS